MSDLRSGELVRLLTLREGGSVAARRRPDRRMVRDSAEDVEPNIICNIPHGELALYVSSHSDGLADAIARKGRGPYGYVPKKITYHLVLWGERPVWVSSEDAELEVVK
jgi:hypothetical protein